MRGAGAVPDDFRLGRPLGTAVWISPGAVLAAVFIGVGVGRLVRRSEILPARPTPSSLDDIDAALRAFDAANQTAYPSLGWAVLAGVLGALAVLLSVLVHELAHLVAARRAGVGATELRLTVLGGFVTLGDPDRLTAGRLAVIAAAGPAATAVLCLVAGAATAATGEPTTAAGVTTAQVARLALFVNAAGLVVNLLPVRPLDGSLLVEAGRMWRRRLRA